MTRTLESMLNRVWSAVCCVLVCACGADPSQVPPVGSAAGASYAAGSAGASEAGSGTAGSPASGSGGVAGAETTAGGSGGVALGGTSGGVSAGGADSGGAGGSHGGVAATKQKILSYLREIGGKQTISGQHNKEPNTDPTRWTNYVKDVTGKLPGLWSGDFLFRQPDVAARVTMIAEAQRQFQAGALINLMWHACAPTVGASCEWDVGVAMHLSDAQWADLVNDGGTLNGTWKQRLDAVASELQKLEDAGVVVMFRPFHEMNQGMFWWAGRTGDNGTKRLFRLTHDYLVQRKGLENLIWIWDVQDLAGYQQALSAYQPGSDYFDVAALDVYEGFNQQKYQALLSAAGDKPVAIGECSKLPSASDLENAPKFVFFMSWAELIQMDNTPEQVKALYAAPRVLTRDELPGWIGN